MLDLVPRPHPLHGCGIITPFRILNAWEAQYCSRVEFLQKRVSPTNNQLQGISLLFMLTFIFKLIQMLVSIANPIHGVYLIYMIIFSY